MSKNELSGLQKPLETELAVRQRYGKASQEREAELCCPVSYPTELLKIIPDEVIQKDYGCGDPTPFVRSGDTVLDLGSGGGKLCFIAAQLAGKEGRVIGVDCNSEMLELARRHQSTVAEKLGFDNLEFRSGMIQDLQLDLDLLMQETGELSNRSLDDYLQRRNIEQRLRDTRPMIEDSSVDCVISNCVLNLVRTEDRENLFREIYRVLKPGGRAAISDIVADEDVPESMQNDSELWSGCISGAWRDDRFVDEFANTGFYGVGVAKWSSEPWKIVNGIEFRSVTVLAYKPDDQAACLECNQSVIYPGPFSQVKDDDNNTYYRGKRMAVCDKTFRNLTNEPYAGMFISITPQKNIPAEKAEEFDCSIDQIRDAKSTKGGAFNIVDNGDGGCCSGDSCC